MRSPLQLFQKRASGEYLSDDSVKVVCRKKKVGALFVYLFIMEKRVDHVVWDCKTLALQLKDRVWTSLLIRAATATR